MSSQAERLTGTIKWYNRKKGFGFVTPDETGEDIFVHHSALQRSLQTRIDVGDRVVFYIEQREKGPSAIDVKQVSNAQSESARPQRPARRKRSGQAQQAGQFEQFEQDEPFEQTEQYDESSEGNPFAALGLISNLLKAVQSTGYTQPTPIQVRAIPQVLSGHDLLACAQTGTGKTAAFALPILQQLTLARRVEHGNGKRPRRAVRALVLSPTRELAIQISDSFSTYGQFTGLKNTVVYGGVGKGPQVQALRRGVDILVATPGRLMDLMGQGSVSLKEVEVFVLDEADRMLDMGFINDVRRISRAMPADRQTLLFSATLPRAIVDLASSILHKPVEVSVTPEQPAVEAIEQAVYFVSTKGKQALLENLLADSDVQRALVFTRTKHGANKVVKKLVKAGVRAEPIHGRISQAARQRALKNFRAGKTRVMVATDVASRGIDVNDISHVIQFDLPNEPETYIHRIGRTGRAGAGGIALAFCAESERSYLKSIEKLIKKRVPVVRAGSNQA